MNALPRRPKPHRRHWPYSVVNSVLAMTNSTVRRIASLPVGLRLTIDRMRDQGTMLVVKFREIADRTAAEKLNGRDLFIDRSALPEPDDEETFYHADLIGLAVVDADGERIGEIVAVPDYGAGDLLEIRPAAGKTFHLPFTRACVPVVDVAGGRVVAVLPEGLLVEAKPEPGEDGADGEAAGGEEGTER